MSRKTTVDQRKLSEIIQRIVKVAAPQIIILFGSAARGKWDAIAMWICWSLSEAGFTVAV